MRRRTSSTRRFDRRAQRSDIRWAINRAASRGERDELIEIALRNGVEV